MEHFSPLISTINGYLEMSIGSGRIRKLDSTMLTSALITTALMHAEIYNLIGGNRPMYANSLEAHRASARFWLDILNPRIPVYLHLPLLLERITLADREHSNSARALADFVAKGFARAWLFKRQRRRGIETSSRVPGLWLGFGVHSRPILLLLPRCRRRASWELRRSGGRAGS